MLALLFVIWLFCVTGKIALISIRAGWGVFRILISVVFFPLTVLGLLISGIIHLSVPILVIIGFITVVKYLTGVRV